MLRVLAVAALLLALPARADEGTVQTFSVHEPARWSVGLMLGAPTGISLKRYLGGRNAFDLNAAAAYGPGLRLGADYLWGLAELLGDRSGANLDFYLGAGGFVGTLQGPCAGYGYWRDTCNGDLFAGVRMPVGLELVFKRVPISLGLEVAPGIAFAPGRAGFMLDASLLVRVLL